MNDPGLDDAIADEANALDHTSPHDQKNDTREIDAQHPHAARWWLASTAYPLAAVCNPCSLWKSVPRSDLSPGHVRANVQRFQYLLSIATMAHGNTPRWPRARYH